MPTIKQAFKIRNAEIPERYKPIYQISYIENGAHMETEFSVSSISTAEINIQEFWNDFCKENNLKTNSVESITCVGDESLSIHA